MTTHHLHGTSKADLERSLADIHQILRDHIRQGVEDLGKRLHRLPHP